MAPSPDYRELSSSYLHAQLGGHAFAWCPELARELGLAVTGADARDPVADVRQLLGC